MCCNHRLAICNELPNLLGNELEGMRDEGFPDDGMLEVGLELEGIEVDGIPEEGIEEVGKSELGMLEDGFEVLGIDDGDGVRSTATVYAADTDTVA